MQLWCRPWNEMPLQNWIELAIGKRPFLCGYGVVLGTRGSCTRGRYRAGSTAAVFDATGKRPQCWCSQKEVALRQCRNVALRQCWCSQKEVVHDCPRGRPASATSHEDALAFAGGIRCPTLVLFASNDQQRNMWAPTSLYREQLVRKVPTALASLAALSLSLCGISLCVCVCAMRCADLEANPSWPPAMPTRSPLPAASAVRPWSCSLIVSGGGEPCGTRNLSSGNNLWTRYTRTHAPCAVLV